MHKVYIFPPLCGTQLTKLAQPTVLTVNIFENGMIIWFLNESLMWKPSYSRRIRQKTGMNSSQNWILGFSFFFLHLKNKCSIKCKYLIHNSGKVKYCPNITVSSYLGTFPKLNLKTCKTLWTAPIEINDWIPVGPDLSEMQDSHKSDSRKSVCNHLSEKLCLI